MYLSGQQGVDEGSLLFSSHLRREISIGCKLLDRHQLLLDRVHLSAVAVPCAPSSSALFRDVCRFFCATLRTICTFCACECNRPCILETLPPTDCSSLSAWRSISPFPIGGKSTSRLNVSHEIENLGRCPSRVASPSSLYLCNSDLLLRRSQISSSSSMLSACRSAGLRMSSSIEHLHGRFP